MVQVRDLVSHFGFCGRFLDFGLRFKVFVLQFEVQILIRVWV
jgi:hypothetical protein